MREPGAGVKREKTENRPLADTSMRVMALRCERATQPDERTGIFTSGIVATREGFKIALFFTGRQHAGENLGDVLKHRARDLERREHDGGGPFSAATREPGADRELENSEKRRPEPRRDSQCLDERRTDSAQNANGTSSFWFVEA